MDFKLVNRITGFIVFLFATIVYVITVQPTLSLWDCGEFLACAYTLSTPHPPGGPLHILVGKIFTMLPTATDIGLRMNYLSVITSSLSALLLYLVIGKAIRNWKKAPYSGLDIIAICVASAIGALSLAFADSFWFNAMEAEVYGFGTFLSVLCIYVLMVWWERADEVGSDKYLLFMAYVVGLSIGIHLLVVQCIFLAGMFLYFRRFEYTKRSFYIAIVASMLAFFIVYPGIVKKFPALISASGILGAILFIGIIIGVIQSIQKKSHLGQFAFLSLFLIILGYSTYISVLQRSAVDNIPLDENNPDNMERLLSYLNREQYGEQPLIWPRRYSQEPQHERTRTLYSSDLEFMWKYQINEMFNRYLFWQYIGRAGYDQGDGVDFKKFYAIPFILGLLGVFYQFKKDWKLAMIFLFMFILMGVVTTLYQNQQDPQPRERDYFYQGAYFVFSLWIGLGVMGIYEQMKIFMKSKPALTAATSGLLILSFVFVPLNMLKVNYPHQSRKGNFFPYDYAYNILQSVDKDAILITNGDNDTFPLWCLQAVYGVRTDVRIVNLSLAQTDWYNLQLKNERPYGALTVPYTMSDEQLRKIQPALWDENKSVSVEIPLKAYPDSMRNRADLPTKLVWKIPATIKQQQGKQQVIALKGNDFIVLDIIKANKWERPIYFSITVSDDNYIGLGDYLVMEGMAQRLVPYKSPDSGMGVTVNRETLRKNLFDTPSEPSKTPRYGFMWRGLDNKDLFYDQTQKRSIESYRTLFLRLAYTYAEDSTTFKLASETLDRMDKCVPKNVIGMDYRIKYDAAMLYNRIGNTQKFNEYADEIEKTALEELTKSPSNTQQYYNPYRILLDIYEARGKYKEAMDILGKLPSNDPTVIQKMESLKQKMGNQPK